MLLYALGITQSNPCHVYIIFYIHIYTMYTYASHSSDWFRRTPRLSCVSATAQRTAEFVSKTISISSLFCRRLYAIRLAHIYSWFFTHIIQYNRARYSIYSRIKSEKKSSYVHTTHIFHKLGKKKRQPSRKQ